MAGGWYKAEMSKRLQNGVLGEAEDQVKYMCEIESGGDKWGAREGCDGRMKFLKWRNSKSIHFQDVVMRMSSYSEHNGWKGAKDICGFA